MAYNKYVYFGKTAAGADPAAGEAYMIPAAHINGIDIDADDRLEINVNKFGDNFSTDKDVIDVEIHSGAAIKGMEQICSALCSNPKDGFIVLDEHTLNYSDSGQSAILGIDFTLS